MNKPNRAYGWDRDPLVRHSSTRARALDPLRISIGTESRVRRYNRDRHVQTSPPLYTLSVSSSHGKKIENTKKRLLNNPSLQDVVTY